MASSSTFLLLALRLVFAFDVDDGHSGGETLLPGVHEPLRHGKLMRQEMRAHGFAASALSMEDGPASLLQRGHAEGINSEESMEAVEQVPPEPAPQPAPLPPAPASMTIAAATVVTHVAAKQKVKCPEVVKMSATDAIKDVHPLSLGVYHLVKTDVDPPIYVNSNHMFYMYFVQATKMWRVGKHFTNVAAAISSNPATEALCPTEVENWYAFDPMNNVSNATVAGAAAGAAAVGGGAVDQQWTTEYRIRVTKESCPYQVRITGAETDQPQLMGTFSMLTIEQDKRAVYKNQNGKFLRFCAALEAWRIGSDANTCGAAVASNATSNNLCPTKPEAWCVLKAGNWTPRDVVVLPIDPVTHDAKGNLETGKPNVDESAAGVPVATTKSPTAQPGGNDYVATASSQTGDYKSGHGTEHIPAVATVHGDREGMNNADYHVAHEPIWGQTHGHGHDDEHGEHGEHGEHEGEEHQEGLSPEQEEFMKAFDFGAASSVDCPADSVDTTEDECKDGIATMAKFGVHYKGASEHADLPHGCIASEVVGGDGDHHEEEGPHDTEVMFNTVKYGDPSAKWYKICRRVKAGEEPKVKMQSIHAGDTTKAPAKVTKVEKKPESRKGMFIICGVVAGLVTVLMIAGCIIVMRRPKKKTEGKDGAQEPLAEGESRAPTQGDYVLVISKARKGWVASPPDDQWRYTITFEDDNSVSELLPFEDIQLIDDAGAVAAPAAN